MPNFPSHWPSPTDTRGVTVSADKVEHVTRLMDDHGLTGHELVACGAIDLCLSGENCADFLRWLADHLESSPPKLPD